MRRAPARHGDGQVIEAGSTTGSRFSAFAPKAALARARLGAAANGPRAAAVLAAGLASAALASFVLALATPRAARPGAAAPIEAVRPSGAADFARLAEADLFSAGAAEAASDGAVDSPDAAPLRATSLDIALVGVRADAAGRGAAVLRVNGRDGVYAVGDAILPGVALDRVEPTRAILARGGALEAALLDRDAAGGLSAVRPATAVAASPAEPPAAPQSAAGARDLKETLLQRFNAAVEIRPRRTDGGLRWALHPKDGSDFLAAAGFRSGDVILAVDGVPIGANPDILLERFESATADRTYSVDIERGGVRTTVEFDPGTVK